MNQNLGLIGKKLGNTQIFTDDGEVRRVTVVETGPCLVVGKRTPEKHGYSAIQLAFGKKKTKSVTKPEAGPFAKLGVDVPQLVKEIRVPADVAAKFEVGSTISLADVFTEGQHVDVTATSKGRGYTGVMKRHNFKGYKRTHGQHEYQRHGGSIGTNMTPGRVLPGKKMAGQHGNSKVTVQNLKVTKVLPDQGLVLVEGSVPGPRGGIVTVRHAAKKAPKA
ncbi:MAG: 50S ribosomal protein L3 [Sandaracinus sp.]|nr:50S ribosomal protein L3 [Sandaracinus sp.]MCB9619717.1 50S ribosomal protein L3 [Sandaracinus sp.]MCB9624033.1 50S ribosomal protein L3 [Sandaracinus sp.]